MALLRRTLGDVLAVFGGQYGSEGKGVIVNHLASEYDAWVRVGAPNAGHTYKNEYGGKMVHQSVPVAAYGNPDAFVVIGRGALVKPELLRQEIEMLAENGVDLTNRLLVDERAGAISPWHENEEGHTRGEIHKRIGSTGEGVGAARRDRMSRNPDAFRFMKDIAIHHGLDEFMVPDTARFLHNLIRGGKSVALEGSQGSGLGLLHGTMWPYVTSTDCGVAQLANDTGIPPSWVNRRHMVVRTYPIRVAGNSGPMGEEIDFETVSGRSGLDLTPETTTVTKKVRRISEWNWDVVIKAVELNDPTSMSMTFLDYWDGENKGVEQGIELTVETRKKVREIETKLNTPAMLLGTGGYMLSVVDSRADRRADL